MRNAPIVIRQRTDPLGRQLTQILNFGITLLEGGCVNGIIQWKTLAEDALAKIISYDC
jgi:hypothetical protein